MTYFLTNFGDREATAALPLRWASPNPSGQRRAAPPGGLGRCTFLGEDRILGMGNKRGREETQPILSPLEDLAVLSCPNLGRCGADRRAMVGHVPYPNFTVC